MVFLVNESMVDISIGQAALTALLGYIVVFFGLTLLMCVITIVGKIMVGQNAKKAAAEKAAAEEAAAAAPKAPVKEIPAAKGTAGELKLHDVDPKTAAMVMAIVADKMGKPINELRFKSIREVK